MIFFTKIKLFFKILKAFYFPKKLIDRYYCVEELTENCIIIKSNPYHFDNYVSLMTTFDRCNYTKLPEEYILFPVPIYNELNKMVNK